MRAPSLSLLSSLRSLSLSSPTSLHSRLPLSLSYKPTTYLPNARTLPTARPFSSSPSYNTTLNQVRRGLRISRRARHAVSPQLRGRPQMKGVCLKVGTTKPKKPNSGQRKTARVKLSNGKAVDVYIPGEGHNVQQHSVILVRGGRSQDCPGVRYHMVRGAGDLGGVANRRNSRSKYGTKKPKAS